MLRHTFCLDTAERFPNQNIFCFFVEMFSATYVPIFYKNIFQLKSGQALIFLFFFFFFFPDELDIFFSKPEKQLTSASTLHGALALPSARGSEPPCDSPVGPACSPGPQLSYLVSANMVIAWQHFTEAVLLIF